ncbi:hypothetical protein ME121_0987 [Methylobacterium sp. ME121]|nr:hypothetical protein ME121_0987 [Methylobacterium sp. ME121]
MAPREMRLRIAVQKQHGRARTRVEVVHPDAVDLGRMVPCIRSHEGLPFATSVRTTGSREKR